MQPDQVYQLLRSLTSPVVAITSERGGKRNGMISDSAVRASIVPAIPRLSVYVHKFNFSHDLIFETGRFVLHLLRTDQFELIHALGRSEEHTSELQSLAYLVCRLLLEKKKKNIMKFSNYVENILKSHRFTNNMNCI